jgi:hypothetical protein
MVFSSDESGVDLNTLDNIPVSGDRYRRDPVAFEAAMEAGRALIASRPRALAVCPLAN